MDGDCATYTTPATKYLVRSFAVQNRMKLSRDTGNKPRDGSGGIEETSGREFSRWQKQRDRARSGTGLYSWRQRQMCSNGRLDAERPRCFQKDIYCASDTLLAPCRTYVPARSSRRPNSSMSESLSLPLSLARLDCSDFTSCLTDADHPSNRSG